MQTHCSTPTEQTLQMMCESWRDETHTSTWGTLTKWDVYGYAFKAVDRRTMTLRRAVEIISEYAEVRPAVVEMRRRDWNGMKTS